METSKNFSADCFDLFRGTYEQVLFAHEIPPAAKGLITKGLSTLANDIISACMAEANGRGVKEEDMIGDMQNGVLTTIFVNAIIYTDELKNLTSEQGSPYPNLDKFTDELRDYMRRGFNYCRYRTDRQPVTSKELLKAVREDDIIKQVANMFPPGWEPYQ